jgi:hypothetical protein
MDKNIIIKNISNATVSLFVPELKMNRELLPGRSLPIDKETYDELTLNVGFNGLTRSHYIAIDGLDANDRVEEIGKVYTKDDIEKMLNTNDVTAFARFIPNAAPAEKETVVDLAVEKRIMTPAIVQLIKKYCDRDIIELINTRHADD